MLIMTKEAYGLFFVFSQMFPLIFVCVLSFFSTGKEPFV